MDKPGHSHQPNHLQLQPIFANKQALSDVSKALLDMRDALTTLSLALKDWQFEHDVNQRKNVRGVAQDLLARLAAPTQ